MDDGDGLSAMTNTFAFWNLYTKRVLGVYVHNNILQIMQGRNKLQG